jgi:hypothetical protein
VPAVLNPKTQWQDGTRRLVMSPLKYMPGVAVEVPRQRRSPWPVARGPHKRLLRGGQYEAVSVAEGSSSDGQVSELAARQLTGMPGSQTAAAHGCRRPAMTCRWRRAAT